MPLYGYKSLCEIKQPIIVSRDYGQPRKHIAHNVTPNNVTHYKLDNIIKVEGKVCDYLLINEDKSVAYLIELKGADLSIAAAQLESTEQLLKTELHSYNILYRIVASKIKTQAVESTSFRKFREKKKHALKYGTEVIEENI